MQLRRVGIALAVAIAAVATSCAQANPQITLSSEQIPRHGHVEVRGAGFTARQNVSSHLRRSDGSEFPVLPILTDERGEFSHTIDTMVLELGSHELWVVDDRSGRTSNHARFEVTLDYPKADATPK
jgi:hypothetical protein